MQPTNVELTELRAAVESEALPIAERQVAAEHLIKMLVSTVKEPLDDDPEVLELQKPWDDVEFAKLMSAATHGHSVNGYALSDAKKLVFDQRKLQVLLSVVVDESIHRLERLMACQVVLEDHLHPRGKFRVNLYTPQRMLDEVLPAGSLRWANHGYRPVERPPQIIADVWA